MTNPIYEKVLITGGGGMLARGVAAQLQQRGVETVLMTRADLDITNASHVFGCVQQVMPSLVINCAAYTKVDLAESEPELATQVNGQAVANLADAVDEACDGFLVHFSTDYVFDGTIQRPLRPGDPIGPASAYGKSKLAGERMIPDALRDDRFLIIRTAWLYGPGGPNFVQTMLKVARAGKPLKVVNDQVGSPTFTHDLADATLTLIDHNAHGIYHTTNSGQTTWFDFARAIFEEFDVTADLAPTTSADWKAQYPNSAPRPAYSVLDCSETERVIGRKLPDWRDGLRRYRNLVEPRTS